MKPRFWIAYVLLGMVFFTACGKEESKHDAAAPAPAVQQGKAARVIDVTLSFIEPRFRPDPIEIYVGEPVQFRVTSADTRHRFVVEPFGINIEVPQKSLNEPVTTAIVTPSSAGSFRIFCSTHARMPMEGTLVVSQK